MTLTGIKEKIAAGAAAVRRAAQTVVSYDYRALINRIAAATKRAAERVIAGARHLWHTVRHHNYRRDVDRLRSLGLSILHYDYPAALVRAKRFILSLPSRIRHYDYRALWRRIKRLPTHIRQGNWHHNRHFSTIDRYILGKYLGTFLLSMVMILAICVVIDISEKLDAFYDNHAPLREIIFDYYVNFIPYFANMLTPLFAFISVIFFTSKMAGNTEITAILAGGISFNRMLRPYVIGSMAIVLMSFVLSGYVIPPANRTRLDFENKYVAAFKSQIAVDIQLEVEPGTILYMERFEHETNRGFHFSLERFNGKQLVSRTTGRDIEFTPEDSVWHISQYMTRDFDGVFETVTTGANMDTMIDVQPQEFFINEQYAPQMTNAELRHYIRRQNERGMGNTQPFEVEYQKRYAMPLASLILMLIGVSLSSKKRKGGMGLQLGIGILLSAIYILFMTISAMFAIKGNMPVTLAVWLPNIVFAAIGVALYLKAPK